MKRSASVLASLLLLTLAVSACGVKTKSGDKGAGQQAAIGGAPASGGDKIVIKFAMVNDPTHPAPTAMKEVFKPMVEQETNGRVQVDLYAGGQLGGEKDELQAVRMGTIQMTYISPLIASVDPKVNVTDLPFLFTDYAHVDKVIDGPLGEELGKDLPAKGGIRSLAMMENGFRKISSSKKAINSPDDLKGLKLRVPEAPLSISIFKTLGTNTVVMSFTEVYSGLQQGVIDGQENAYVVWTSSKLYEVQKYAAATNHMWGSFYLLTNDKWFTGLPKDIQDVITKAAKAASKRERELLRKQEADAEKLLTDKGVTVTHPDREAFVKAVQPVYDDFYKQYPQYKPLVEQIIAAGK